MNIYKIVTTDADVLVVKANTEKEAVDLVTDKYNERKELLFNLEYNPPSVNLIGTTIGEGKPSIL